jgi:dTDP-4-amino-4,6-dideoxygalactose transaminase
MNVPMADIKAQHLPLKAELAEALNEVMESCQFILGPNVTEFQNEIAKLSGASHGIGLNSGTDALLLALVALGVGPGDEVITTPFTFVATAETICLAGATPVFADIDPKTFNLDVAKTAEKITSKTKAIMPVHLFGQMADMAAFGKLAQEKNVHLVADGAQAIGALQNGKEVATFSELTTLSFFPTKNLGACGDGGMVLTDSDDLAEKIRVLRFHGSGGGYIYKEIGYCSRLDEIQAALLRVKARHLHRWNEARRSHASQYGEQLAGLEERIALPAVFGGNHHVYHQYTVRVPGGKRDTLQAHLKSKYIGSGIYYPRALHLFDTYSQGRYKLNDFPESELATEEVLSLPVNSELSSDQVGFVCETIREFFA